MLTRTTVIVAALAIATTVFAQTSRPSSAPALVDVRPAAAAAAEPITGTVVGTSVNVRSGPGTTAYVCTQLNAPDTVTIVGKKAEWLMVLPPKSTYSVIAKGDVTADADGKGGTVNKNDVWCRAAGDKHTANCWAIQVRLNKGDKVQFLGEQGDDWKITPPAGVSFYISEQFVKKQGEVKDTTVSSVAVKTGTGGGVDVKLPDTLPSNVGTITSVEATPAAMSSVDAAEKALQDEYKKPAQDRDYQALLARFKAIKTDNEQLKAFVDSRIAYIQHSITTMDKLHEVDVLIASGKKTDTELAGKIKDIQIEKTTSGPVYSYTAQGVVVRSSLFPGNSNAPERFMLREPDTLRVSAYIQCTSGKVTLTDYVGKFIGVKGGSKYVKELNIDVVEVDEVVVLSDKADLPKPPAVKITEGEPASKPKPAVTPTVAAPAVDTPKVDTPKVDTPKVDAPKVDTPKVDAPKTGAAADTGTIEVKIGPQTKPSIPTTTQGTVKTALPPPPTDDRPDLGNEEK